MVKQILSRASLLLLALPAVLAASSDCVNTCETSHPIISFCDGGETGSALADCTCESYESGSALISCIKGCPADQVSTFANSLPEKCRSSLFPNVTGGSSPSTSGSGSQSTSAPASTAAGQTTPASTAAANTGSATSSAPSSATSTGAAVANINAEWRSPAALVAGALGLLML